MELENEDELLEVVELTEIDDNETMASREYKSNTADPPQYSLGLP